MAARKKATRKATTSRGAKRKTSAPKKASAKKAGSKKAGAKKATARKAGAKKVTRKVSATAAPRKAAARKGGAKKAVRKSARKAAAAVETTAFPEIEALALLMEKHGLLEVKFSSEPDGATKIQVSKMGSGPTLVSAPMAAAPAPVAAAADAAPGATEAPAAAASDESLHAFRSPMVGTFYRAPSPEATPFVNVGDAVDPAGAVCIIEAMKVMNEIQPDAAGEVVSIEVENGEAVEFGQTLMLLRAR